MAQISCDIDTNKKNLPTSSSHSLTQGVWLPVGMALLLVSVATCLYPSSGHAVSPAANVIAQIQPAPQVEEAYTLGAGDRVRIDIFRVSQYSGDNEVLVDGSLNLPFVGSIQVQGMTLEQASSAISAKYASILRRPIVTVTLLTPRPLQIGVGGEVNRPGAYTISREQGAQFPTITQILETAGGIRQSADLRQVQIRRQRMGAEQVITVDLWQLLQTGDLRYDVSLRDGDTVFIPTATNISLVESSQLASASFAAEETPPINIAVVGQVFRPGPYTVAGTARTAAAGMTGGTDSLGTSPTVTRAIQVAGGITPLADIRNIQIRRPTRSGAEQTFEVDLWQLLEGGDLQQDVILQDRDTVFIPTATTIDSAESARIAAASFSPNSMRVNVVGEVTRPGVVEVPPNTPLNQALLAAGGFNNRARRSSVRLVRLNPNGSVSTQEIDVDFEQGVNNEANPALRNDDIIIVGRSGLASFTDSLETATNPIARFFTLFSLPLNFFRLF